MASPIAATALALLFASSQASPRVDALGVPESSGLRDSVLKAAAGDDMGVVVRNILIALDRPAEALVVREGDVQTAAATSSPRGARIILYNPKAFADLRRTTKGDWGAVFLLTHEVVHHLLGHATTAKPSPDRYKAVELEVNEVAGWVMKRLGASLHEAMDATTAVCRLVTASETDTAATVAAMGKGWRGDSMPRLER